MAAAAASASEDPNPERTKLLEKMKKEIRGILLTATKSGLSPAELERDFMDLNNRPLPLNQLGFSDIYEFLDAIPDVIEAFEVNGQIVLFAKSTKATAHLEHLIARAKPNKLGRFGGVIQQAPECRRGTKERRKLIEKRLVELAQRCPDYVTYYDLFNAYQQKYHEALDARGDFNCQPKALFTIKLEHLFELRGSVGSGNFSVRLKDDARKTVPPPVGPTANILGAGGFDHRTAQVPPAVSQENRENISPSSRPVPFSIRPEDLLYCVAPGPCPITTMVQSFAPRHIPYAPFPLPPQPGPFTLFRPPPFPVPPMRMMYPPMHIVGPPAHHMVYPPMARFMHPVPIAFGGDTAYFGQGPPAMPFSASPVPEMTGSEQQLPERTSSADSGYPKSASAPSCPIVAPAVPALPPADELFVEDAPSSPVRTPVAQPDLSDVRPKTEDGGEGGSKAPTPTPAAACCTKTLEIECRKVLKRFPSGVPYLAFAKAYWEVIGKELDLEPYNALSVNELVEDVLPDVFERKTNEKGTVVLYAKQPAQAEDPIVGWAENAAEDAIIRQVWLLTMKRPQRSLYLHEIPTIYENATGKSFPIDASEFEEFSLKLFDYNDRFNFIFEESSNNVRLIAIPESGDDIPPECVQPCQSYKPQGLPLTRVQLQQLDNSDPQRYIQVIMAQVNSPGQFYVQLLSMCSSLEELVTDLNNYLCKEGRADALKTSSASLRVDTPCACLVDEYGVWYRGIVKDAMDEKRIIVLLVDFGTEVAVDCANICYLPSQYVDQPAQAIPARLAMLRPRGQDWSPQDGEMLADLCGSTEMWAEVQEIDEGGVAAVFLTLTDEKGKEMIINETLIKLGVAAFDETEKLNTELDALHTLEEEIEPPDVPTIIEGGKKGAGESEYQESADEALNTALEEDVVNEMQAALEEGSLVPEVVHIAWAYLCRRRLAINALMAEPVGEASIAVAVDKLNWLEDKINWLDSLRS